MTAEAARVTTSTTPPEPGQLVDQHGAQVGPHECENGDGQRVRYVLVDLDMSEVQALCAACTMGMFVGVAAQLAEQQAGAVSDNAGGGV
jgi:hypothetical protein